MTTGAAFTGRARRYGQKLDVWERFMECLGARIKNHKLRGEWAE